MAIPPLSVVEELRGQPRRTNSWLRQMPHAVLASEAQEILAALSDATVEVNAFHFSTAMSACDRSGLWQHGLEVLKEMKDMRMQPNLVCWNGAMAASEHASAWATTLQLLVGLKAEGLTADEISINTALCACRRK
ncbi:unnamed protein product [Durusdinium trenchii]|uniref:Pentatricopeptide repeat-containing protein n=1 Tax=Durusdinium trenchii TaxID=1381693 RepID=A0ABP0IZT7_9DINO